MTAVLEAVASIEPPRRVRRHPLVVRFSMGLTRAAWLRLAYLMHHHRCLTSNALRLARFLAQSDDGVDWHDGRVCLVDEWTGQEHDRAGLAAYYANWAGCAASAFAADLACLRAAGLVEDTAHPDKPKHKSYVLVVNTAAIERMPPASIGLELQAELRLDVLFAQAAEPDEDDSHVVIGGISRAARERPESLVLHPPVSLVDVLAVPGRSREFAEQLAEEAAGQFAGAPRWEHPAASPAARVSAGIRDHLKALPEAERPSVHPHALAVAEPLPEVLRPAHPTRGPVDNRPPNRSRSTKIRNVSFYTRGHFSTPLTFLPAVTRVRGFQGPDGTAKPKRTPQRAAGFELDPVELRAGGALALAIRKAWKGCKGLPQIPDVASWDDNGEPVTDPAWAFFVTTVTLALQRTSRDHVWRRATDDVRTLADLLKGVGARLWREIIHELPRVWPANAAPSGRKTRPGQGTTVAGAAAEWVADASGGDVPDRPRTVAEPESVLAGLHSETDEHRRRGELFGLEERIAAHLAAEGWTALPGTVTELPGDDSRDPDRRGRADRSRTIRRPGVDPGQAAAAKARAEAAAAEREVRDQMVADQYARWGVDVDGAAATVRRAADLEQGPELKPGESQARAKAEADRMRGRRTVADRARAILGDQADDEPED